MFNKKNYLCENDLKNVIFKLSTFSTCKRLQVGSLVALKNDNNLYSLIGCGYNYNIYKDDCCFIDNSKIEEHRGYSDKYEIHAEQVAIIDSLAFMNNSNKNNFEIWVSHFPCFTCLKLIVATNKISKIKYFIDYDRLSKDDKSEMINLLKSKSIEVEKVALC